MVAGYRKLIPQLDRFFERFDNLANDDARRRVLAHAQNIFLALLRLIKEQSDRLAHFKQATITELAVTIPPNWDQWTQHLYVLLLNRIWDNLGPSAITIIYESEAIGHWLLSPDQAITQMERPKRCILGDFGGHILVSDEWRSRYPAAVDSC